MGAGHSMKTVLLYPFIFVGIDWMRSIFYSWDFVYGIDITFMSQTSPVVSSSGYMSRFSTLYLRTEPGSGPVDSCIQVSGTFLPLDLGPSLEEGLWVWSVCRITKRMKIEYLHWASDI